ncbi:hypothetical protein ACFTWH_09235 [Streptomyces sp. NPDC057011]|uniref:hypothetical protein n=1 Tax=unclassified Streptomyces TaxID=2593676 RepID=UPI00362CD00F
MLRPVAVRRLLALEGRDELTPSHVRMVAGTLGVSERTVRRWLAAAREEDRFGPVGRERFTVMADVLARLAFHRGNAAALHREPAAAQAGGGVQAPSPGQHSFELSAKSTALTSGFLTLFGLPLLVGGVGLAVLPYFLD